MASQKQFIALQWELQQMKHNANEERNQSRKIHRRIQELELQNQVLMSSAANSDSGGLWGKRNNNEETEEQSFRVIDRQEFSILVLDSSPLCFSIIHYDVTH
jgi:hypothetical protein